MTNPILRTLRNGWLYGVFFTLLSLWVGFPMLQLAPKQAILLSVAIGALAWLVNGFMFNRFTKSVNDLDKIRDPVVEGVLIILESPANFYIDEHIVSGKLFLTKTDLIFVAHQKSDEGQKEDRFPLAAYDKFKFFRSIFNPGGEFMIENNDGHQFVFEVDSLNKWKENLTRRP